jgi:hypothetical protein
MAASAAGWRNGRSGRLFGRAGRLTAGGPVPRRLLFVFHGRVSTEDWQDPVTSRGRQREQAEAPVRGHGVIVAEFFDAGQSRPQRGAGVRKPPSWSPAGGSRSGLGCDRGGGV